MDTPSLQVQAEQDTNNTMELYKSLLPVSAGKL